MANHDLLGICSVSGRLAGFFATMRFVRAELLTIGDELCRGEIGDTNSAFLAAELWDLGVVTNWMTSCRDDRVDVVSALVNAAARADVVVVSGGLGPTEDDLTVDAVAEAVGVEPVVDEPSLLRMKARFARSGYTLTPNNLKQVRIPRGATAFANPAGIAPGFSLRLGSAQLFVMPGVPCELRAIWTESVAPRVAALAEGGELLARRVLRVFGMGESHIDHRLSGLATDASASVHYQVAYPETLVKVVVRAKTRSEAEARLETLVAAARQRLGEVVYGEGDDSLAAVLVAALRARRATLAVAESCTGGMLGALVTAVPGASDVFVGGWIVYANDAKLRLGVCKETLVVHGAVSGPCVEELALRARDTAGATLGVAISGIAGPEGGTPEKPVGTVYVAVAGENGGLLHEHYTFSGTREQIRRLASYRAMNMILSEVKL